MFQDAAWRERMARVLSGALRLWGIAGTVERDAEEPEGFVVAVAEGTVLRVVHHAPHGWRVLPDGTVHAGLPGLLRYLREELAPQANAGRLIIAAQPPR